jgi:hypothetical protein
LSLKLPASTSESLYKWISDNIMYQSKDGGRSITVVILSMAYIAQSLDDDSARMIKEPGVYRQFYRLLLYETRRAADGSSTLQGAFQIRNF